MSDDLWEDHAAWWIDGFTEGADPEYVEQILPLAVAAPDVEHPPEPLELRLGS